MVVPKICLFVPNTMNPTHACRHLLLSFWLCITHFALLSLLRISCMRMSVCHLIKLIPHLLSSEFPPSRLHHSLPTSHALCLNPLSLLTVHRSKTIYWSPLGRHIPEENLILLTLKTITCQAPQCETLPHPCWILAGLVLGSLRLLS